MSYRIVISYRNLISWALRKTKLDHPSLGYLHIANCIPKTPMAELMYASLANNLRMVAHHFVDLKKCRAQRTTAWRKVITTIYFANLCSLCAMS